eukprot:SAG31_NODE_35_length_31836_cov_10.841352_35_plen_47_part_00
MQGKDWVVECARLEAMLQQAYTIVTAAQDESEELKLQQQRMLCGFC